MGNASQLVGATAKLNTGKLATAANCGLPLGNNTPKLFPGYQGMAASVAKPGMVSIKFAVDGEISGHQLLWVDCRNCDIHSTRYQRPALTQSTTTARIYPEIRI